MTDVSGEMVYDPRRRYVASDNPALWLAEYAERMGHRVDWAHIALVADWCDEPVRAPGDSSDLVI